MILSRLQPLLRSTFKPVLLLALMLMLITWLLWPVYDFYAHRGKMPFLPFAEFTAIPNSYPTQQSLLDSRYKYAASTSLSSLTEHAKTIHAPAISAAVAIDGELKWAGVSGWADVEQKRAITTDSQFRIGSTSKALTSIVLARMVDKGLIDLDTNLASYFETLPNASWQFITPRQLASHTAGLPHYKENTDRLGLYQTMALQNRFEDVMDAVDVFDTSTLLFEPGNQFSYSSLGTVLLSATMQQAGKQPFLTMAQDLVFTPLGLTATNAEYHFTDTSNFASFYWNDKGRQSVVKPWRSVDLSHRLAGGGFVSTPSELVKMGSQVMNDEFISKQTRQAFWTPTPLADGSMPPHNYAVGWRVIEYDLGNQLGKTTVVNHGGVSRGSQSWLMLLPDYEMTVAININANTHVFWDFASVSMEIAKAFITAEINEE